MVDDGDRTGVPPESNEPRPVAGPASRGGLIVSVVLGLWIVAGFALRGTDWAAMSLPAIAGTAVLFWRSLRGRMAFGQGLAVFFGGFLVGMAPRAMHVGHAGARLGLLLLCVLAGTFLVSVGGRRP